MEGRLITEDYPVLKIIFQEFQHVYAEDSSKLFVILSEFLHKCRLVILEFQTLVKNIAVLSGSMLPHGSLSELTSWGCVGRIAELYPLSPFECDGRPVLLPLHRQPVSMTCVCQRLMEFLSGGSTSNSPKVALNCDNRRCLCVFHSTKCLLLFRGRPRERRVFQSKLRLSSSDQCNLHHFPHTGLIEKSNGFILFLTLYFGK